MESYDPIPEHLIEKMRHMSGCSDVRELPGCPLYAVTATGLVYSVHGRGTQSRLRKTPYQLKKTRVKGWLFYRLMRADRRQVIYSVAKCVALAFVGAPPEPDMEAFTINGDPDDIRPDNLQWGTRSAHRLQGVELHGGAFVYGEALGHSKLTPDVVEQMRQDARDGLTQQAIADKYGVHRRTAGRAIRGVHWKQVDAPTTAESNYAKGSQVSLAKFDEAQVRAIRALIAQGVSLSEIARRYDVSVSTIQDIRDRKTWKHVT